MRSDLYTIAFTTIITVILGLGLSATADSLRERQVLNEELDIKKNILSVLGYKQDTPWTNEEVQSLYDANICLLYTSPSPRDGLLSRMPSSA